MVSAAVLVLSMYVLQRNSVCCLRWKSLKRLDRACKILHFTAFGVPINKKTVVKDNFIAMVVSGKSRNRLGGGNKIHIAHNF